MILKPMYIAPESADKIFNMTKPLTFVKSLMGMMGTSKGTKTSSMKLKSDVKNCGRGKP
jgi:hypothetical protein